MYLSATSRDYIQLLLYDLINLTPYISGFTLRITMYKGFVFINVIAMLFTTNLWAKELSKVFIQYETNQTDHINTIGVSNFIPFPNSDFGAEALTSFSYAQVMTDSGTLEQYLAWEAGFRMGYYGTISAYIEAGVDLSELILEQERNDCCDLSDDPQEDSVDGYIGVGTGLQLDVISIEVFARLRQIDSRYWQSAEYAYYGVQLSVQF